MRKSAETAGDGLVAARFVGVKAMANIQMEPTRRASCAILSPWRAAHLKRSAPSTEWTNG